MSKKKIHAQDESGTIEWRANRWQARISIPGRGRPRIELRHPDSGRELNQKEGDRDLAKALAAEMSSTARADALKNGPPQDRITVKEFGEDYTSGRLLKKHGEVRGLRAKKSMDSDAMRLRAHVYPYIGDMAVADVQEADIERCWATAIAAAEKKNEGPWSAATKVHLYQVMHRLFDLAVKPGRLRPDNPVSVDLKPRRDPPKMYSFLYPNELVRVINCFDVPLGRRVYYLLATYTGLRKGSLARFTWECIDFEHKAISSYYSKTGVAQYFAQIDPMNPGLESVLSVLHRWWVHCGKPKGDTLVVRNLHCKANHEASTLRQDLQLAGVTRATLFKRAPNVELLRFHDLRATFVTWARRAGKGEGWISDRTGHLTSAMLARYDRGARTLEEMQILPFPDISAAIPELATSNGASNVIQFPRS